jgi:LemA protein
MSSGLFFLLALLAAPLVWGVFAYNRLVALRNRCQNAFSQIDVQLRRRHDLIPALVDATRGYLRHERQTLESVIAARKRASDATVALHGRPPDAGLLVELDSAEQALAGPLSRLVALAEDYPELRADETVHRLTDELATTENRIAFSRQAYNDIVTRYNTGVESFPASVIAGLFGFRRSAMLRAATRAAHRDPVAVSL